MLHVLNGDETRTVFERAGLPGEAMVWRDILVEGPVNAGSDAVPALDARVAFLAERLAIDRDTYTRGARAQADALDAAGGHDEVVLWFEQDLFCAVNLWRLLDWFARRAPATQLSLVYPATDDLQGLGAAEPEHLAALFAGRIPVSEEMRALGARAWAAYASADPLDSAPLVDRDDTALPFVRGGFRCHLGRFPSVANGLNEVETATLAALRRGPREFPALFREVRAHPRVRRHGMGDVQFAAAVRGLAPLLRFEDRPGFEERPGSAGALQASKGGWGGPFEAPHLIQITQLGRDVVSGDTDWLSVRPIDTWLGGVRLLAGRPLWRWDGARGRLVPSAA
jgi:hypothetical protein